MKILIATSTAPKTEESFKHICSLIRSVAEEKNLKVINGILWTAGPGCSNLALEVEGDNEIAEKLANELTMALMPSRWCITRDELPEVDTWVQ